MNEYKKNDKLCKAKAQVEKWGKAHFKMIMNGSSHVTRAQLLGKWVLLSIFEVTISFAHKCNKKRYKNWALQ